MAKCGRAAMLAAVGMLLPFISLAQGLANEMNSLHGVLDQLYDEMIPLCSKLIGVGRGIAGFAATWYIGSRVWRHISNAEPIDFYPLFRPFVLGFAVMIFPSVLAMINGVLKPTVSATGEMMKDSNKAIAVLLKEKEKAIQKSPAWEMYEGADGSGDYDRWNKYTHEKEGIDDGGLLESMGSHIRFVMDKAAYKFRNSIKQWMSEVLRVLYEAAALCINTIRTFNLIVLAILGPLVFGIAVFDGFQHTLTVWLARYINVYLWLPVANIFGSIIGKIQEKMLALDLSKIADSGDTFFSSTDTAYLIFMIIGIIGYFTVPSVANFIVNAGGGNAILYKVNSMFGSTGSNITNMASSGAGMAKDAIVDAGKFMNGSMADQSLNAGYFSEGGSGKSSHMKDKLSGKS